VPKLGETHRVHHSWGNRHGPQCQQHPTQQGFHHPLEQQRPGPHFLLTFTVPETRRPFIRSPPRIAYPALFNASSFALKRLAKDARVIGTDLPGCTGVLPTWGRQLQSPPHLPDIGPGGGLSKDRTTWLPSRAHFFAPVKALSPIYRALFKEDRRQAGLLERVDPQVCNIAWKGHSQAPPNGPTSFKYLAPDGFNVALSNRRLVSHTDRPGTFTDRKPGRARPRPPHLDAVELIRRFLPHVLPDGFMKVRPFGFLNTRCALPTDPLRRLIWTRHPGVFKTPALKTPAPVGASCPPCGAPMQVVWRRWSAQRVFLDPG
jgi:Putative transposase